VLQVFNLFDHASANGSQERFETLLRCPNLELERIISPAGSRSELFVQEQDEWVAVIQGEALLEMAGEQLTLSRGDSLFIPAHTPHQVLQTSQDPLCIWLALHIHSCPPLSST
jgi:cupin 2 domain-containing protein